MIYFLKVFRGNFFKLIVLDTFKNKLEKLSPTKMVGVNYDNLMRTSIQVILYEVLDMVNEMYSEDACVYKVMFWWNLQYTCLCITKLKSV